MPQSASFLDSSVSSFTSVSFVLSSLGDCFGVTFFDTDVVEEGRDFVLDEGREVERIIFVLEEGREVDGVNVG